MDVTSNPWIINAADVTGLGAVSGNGNNPGDIISVGGTKYLVVWRGPAKILQVEFVNYVAGTDTAQVFSYPSDKTATPKDFAFLNGNTDFETVRTGFPGWAIDGLLIADNGIINGEVKIYHA